MIINENNKENGFTLVELLVVIAIIGILAAIAIPEFTEYRKRAFDSQAEVAMRNGATAEEAYFVDNDLYVSCDEDGGTHCYDILPGVESINGVHLDFTAGFDGQSFTGWSSHLTGGTGKIYTWDSNDGGFQ